MFPTHELKLPIKYKMMTTDILENNQWTVDTADGVVAYPRLDRHHAGIDRGGRHGCRWRKWRGSRVSGAAEAWRGRSKTQMASDRSWGVEAGALAAWQLEVVRSGS